MLITVLKHWCEKGSHLFWKFPALQEVYIPVRRDK